MTNRSNGTAQLTQSEARQPVTWTSVTKSARTARGAVSRACSTALTTAQHTMTVFGLSAVAVAVVLYARPDVARNVSQLLSPGHEAAVAAAPAPDVTALMAPPSAALVAVHTSAHNVAPSALTSAVDGKPAPLSAEEKAILGSAKQQQFVTSWLSKRYRVANDAANMLVSTAYLTAKEIKIDPLLILAVMAIESGLNPFAESPVGAQGLMQVMSKVHHARFREMGGAKAALNPVANIRVGAQILKEYVNRGGSVEAGLKTYVGAAAFESDSGYGSRVLAEWQRLKMVAVGKKVPTSRPAAPAAPAPVMADKSAPTVAHKAETANAAVPETESIAGL